MYARNVPLTLRFVPTVKKFLKKAVVPGFEPGQTEPKPVVLPLHHTTIALYPKGRANIMKNPLFGYKQIVVLFPSLKDDVVPVNEIGLSEGA